MTHICRSYSHHHICTISQPSCLHPTFYQILHMAMHSKLKTNNILLFNKIQSFISFLWKICYQEGELHASYELWCSHNITVFLYVTPCSLAEQHQYFTWTFPSIREEDKGSNLIHNGAVPIYWLQCAAADKTVTFPHLLHHSQVTGIPNDSVNRLQPHGHSASPEKAFLSRLPVNK